jgi:hypothetical protein
MHDGRSAVKTLCGAGLTWKDRLRHCVWETGTSLRDSRGWEDSRVGRFGNYIVHNERSQTEVASAQ